MQKNHYLFVVALCTLVGCNALKREREPKQYQTKQNESSLWYIKDPVTDKVPGIALERFHAQKKVSKTGNTIIVAVLDTQIDSDHEDLKGQLWQNEKEIPDNRLDDDHNGYTDDVHGWNFLGKKNGGFFSWGNLECVRIVRNFKNYFQNKDTTKLLADDLYHFNEYKKALNELRSQQKYYEGWRNSVQFRIGVYPEAKAALKKIFPREDYTLHNLDSVYKIYKTNDKPYWERRDANDHDLGALIDYMRAGFQSGQKNLDDIIKTKIELDSILQRNLSLDYNERDFIGDDPQKLDKGYGNNKVSEFKANQKHSTEVSALLAANGDNEVGIRGFSNQIRIMPLSILLSGDEYDKDVALAIYYAVDNGAKIINMSFGKEFSLQQQWVTDAIQYAEKKKVLIVHIAGNNRKNLDDHPYFPSDYSYKDHTKICNNLITVGATTQSIDSTLVYQSSGYGKKNVDLFAPGHQIYTAKPNNLYGYDSGTSLAAPLVSGTAALIWLHYPNLSVTEVKQIILDSGTTFDLDVLIPGGEGKKTPFSELSKSGKILNTYNAMQMAAQAGKKQ